MAERGLNRWISWIKRACPSRKRSWGGETEEAWREWFTRWLALYQDGHFADAHSACHQFVVKHPWLLKVDFICIRLAELELLGNRDSCRALELLDRAKKQGFSDAIRYYYVRSIAESEGGLYEASKCDFEEYAVLEPDLHLIKRKDSNEKPGTYMKLDGCTKSLVSSAMPLLPTNSFTAAVGTKRESCLVPLPFAMTLSETVLRPRGMLSGHCATILTTTM